MITNLKELRVEMKILKLYRLIKTSKEKESTAFILRVDENNFFFKKIIEN